MPVPTRRPSPLATAPGLALHDGRTQRRRPWVGDMTRAGGRRGVNFVNFRVGASGFAEAMIAPRR